MSGSFNTKKFEGTVQFNEDRPGSSIKALTGGFSAGSLILRGPSGFGTLARVRNDISTLPACNKFCESNLV